MTQFGVLGEEFSQEIDGTGMEASMQRLSILSDLVFITKSSGGNHSFEVLLDNQVTLHVFKKRLWCSIFGSMARHAI